MAPNFVAIMFNSTRILDKIDKAVTAIEVAMKRKKPIKFMDGSANSLYIITETPTATPKGMSKPM